MVNSGMLICSFYLKKRFKRGGEELVPLNAEYEFANEEGRCSHFENALDIIYHFCQRSITGSDDEKLMKLFSIESNSIQKSHCSSYSVLTFIVSSGSYGIEAEITNRHTREVKYTCTEDDAPVKRFRCLVYIPDDTKRTQVNKGIFIFQTIGSFGVKTITTKHLKSFCADIGLTVETRSVSVRMFIEKLIEKGRLYKVTFTRNKVSPDNADNMLISSGREEKSFIHPLLKPEWIKKLLNAVDGAKQSELLEYDNDEYDDIKVTFQLEKSLRTVRLAEIDHFSVVEDIPEHIWIRSKTDEKCIIDYMIETAKSYAKKMIFSIEEA